LVKGTHGTAFPDSEGDYTHFSVSMEMWVKTTRVAPRVQKGIQNKWRGEERKIGGEGGGEQPKAGGDEAALSTTRNGRVKRREELKKEKKTVLFF